MHAERISLFLSPRPGKAMPSCSLIACARVLTDYFSRAVVSDVIIHPDFQRQDLGRELMRQVAEHPPLKDVEYFFSLSSG